MRHFTRATTKARRPQVFPPIHRRSPLARSFRSSSDWSQARHRRINLQQPWISWRTLGLWSFYGATSYFALQYLLGRIVDGLELEEDLQEAAEEGDEEESEDEDKEVVVLSLDDDGGDDSDFISVQAPKQLPRQNYKHSDPEWQEFIKLSKDKDRQQVARRELAEKLVRTASSLKPLKQRLGNDIKWTKSWLDFKYPDQAAPEYIRRGWLLLEDGAMWSKQIIPHSQYVQLQHILWPKALYRAGRSCLSAFYDLQAIKVKNALGIDLEPKEKQLQIASKVIVMQMNAKAKLDQAKEQLDQAKLDIEKKPEMQQQMQKQNADKLGPPGDKDAQRGEAGMGKSWDVKEIKVTVPSPALSSDLVIASRMFVGTLTQVWKESKLDSMPPGCCFLSGDIELSGSRARCKMGVMAAYDPKANTFVWVNSKPKAFWVHSQTPKGGA